MFNSLLGVMKLDDPALSDKKTDAQILEDLINEYHNHKTTADCKNYQLSDDEKQAIIATVVTAAVMMVG
jgi:hypothetical protein